MKTLVVLTKFNVEGESINFRVYTLSSGRNISCTISNSDNASIGKMLQDMNEIGIKSLNDIPKFLADGKRITLHVDIDCPDDPFNVHALAS